MTMRDCPSLNFCRAHKAFYHQICLTEYIAGMILWLCDRQLQGALHHFYKLPSNDIASEVHRLMNRLSQYTLNTLGFRITAPRRKPVPLSERVLSLRPNERAGGYTELGNEKRGQVTRVRSTTQRIFTFFFLEHIRAFTMTTYMPPEATLHSVRGNCISHRPMLVLPSPS